MHKRVEPKPYKQVVDGAEMAAGSEAPKRLKQAFRRAKANAPAVLFIDSLDALAPARCLSCMTPRMPSCGNPVKFCGEVSSSFLCETLLYPPVLCS